MKKSLFSMHKVTALLLSCLCIVQAMVLPICGSDQNTLPLPQVSGASSIYLYHYESDQILLKRSSLKQIAPASTVKIMTGMLALEKLRDRMDETVTLSEEMLEGVEGFKIHLEPGMTVSMRDLLYGVICAGGNDAAQVLAIVCSGSVDAFVEEMNEKAIAIGCTDTRYQNPSGMDDSQMTTTLDDVIRLSKAACCDEDFLTIASCSQYSISTQQKTLTLYNRNALISTFSGMGYQNRYVKGLNAGMTDRGGHCAVAFAQKDSNTYLCIVMGATESNGSIQSYNIVNTLLNYVIDTYSYQQIAPSGTTICQAPIVYVLPTSEKNHAEISCVLDQDLYGFLPRNIQAEDLNYQTFFHRAPLSAPIEEGTVVGGVDIYYGDQYIASAKLLVKETTEANKTLLLLANMKKMILSRAFVIFLFSTLILSCLYFLFFDRQAVRSYKKKQER